MRCDFRHLLAPLLLSSLPVSGQALDCVINPSSRVELGSHQDGVLDQVLVKRGDLVQQGQALAVLDREMEQRNAELARIRAESETSVRSSEVQADFRARERERLEALRDNRSVSESAFEQAKIEHDLARLALEAAELESEIAGAEYDRVQAQLARRTIKSPLDGVVVEVVMSPGEYVHEQSTLMHLAAVDPLYVEVYVPVASYGQVEKGMTAVVRPEAPVGGEHVATILAVDAVFDAASRTFGVRLQLPNPEHKLPAGLRCTVTFPK